MAALAAVVGTLLGLFLLTSGLYTYALTHPGCHDSGTTPEAVGIVGAQDVTYPSADGLPLRAWYLPPQNGAVIVLLPGLGGGRDGMMREGAILSRSGYGLLMSGLRSCSQPQGQTTLGYLESADLVAAVTWVLAQPDVRHVGVAGFSLGGVTAILGAARDERIEAVVAEGGFYDLAADITEEGRAVPWYKTLFFQAILVFFRLETGIDAHDVSPISVIGDISPRPLLLIYGEFETPARPQEQLARAGEPKELWIVPGCGHGGYLDVAGEEWAQRVPAFFDAALK